MKTYSEKLKDPRWQKKRLRIFERDGWCCQFCLAQNNTLHVHHKVYMNGCDPWDYEDRHLITLCENCHQNEHNHLRKSVEQVKINHPEMTPQNEPTVIAALNHQIHQLTQKLSEDIDLGLETEILKNLMFLYETKKKLTNG